MRHFVSACLAVFCFAAATAGQSPVDETAPLETVSTDFVMSDGPSWDGASTLYVPDVKAGKLYSYQPGKKKLQVVLADAGRISATAFNHGRLYLADNGEGAIATLDHGHKRVLVGLDKSAKPALKPNDLCVDNAGGVYYTLTAAGRVGYLAADGKQLDAAEGIDSPNGIVLAPDEQTLYVSSYAPKQVWAFDVTAPGKLSGRRLLATLDEGEEKGADGLTVDRAGNIYCAGPKQVSIWSPSGKLLGTIVTPSRPINCAFGDGDMRGLYITCLGGLYRQPMRISGRSPQPPSRAEDQTASDVRTSTALPKNVDAHLDVVFARYGDRKLLMDIFVPRHRPGPLPTIVVVHGGGWVSFDKTRFRSIALALAERGYVTAACEYRLGGEAHFPAAIQDCNAAVRFLRAQAGRYHVDPQRIGAVGGSAGAHLVGLMAAAPGVHELEGDGGNGNQSSALQAAVVMAGPMELATGRIAERSRKGGNSGAVSWLGKTIDQDRSLYELASPYSHFSAKTPPMLFMTGELDDPERDLRSIARLKELGVWAEQKVYKGAKHGCWMRHPWFDEMIADMDAFFQVHLK